MMDTIFGSGDFSKFEKMNSDTSSSEELQFMRKNIGTMKSKILCSCAMKGHFNAVKYLVENGVDIEDNGDFAFERAVSNGHLEVVKYLIESGANINTAGGWALRSSAEKGHLEVVKYLIENGANIHVADDWALRSSAENGHLGVVKYLVKKSANIRAGNNFALRWSARNGHLEIVKYLIENGADVHAGDNFALRWSAINGNLGREYSKMISSDSIYYSQFKKKSHGAVHFYAGNKFLRRDSVWYNYFGVIKCLLENGADISVLQEYQIFNLIDENIIVNNTSSELMQYAWDTLVQPVKDNKSKVLDQLKTEAMEFLLRPGTIRVKILEHQFTCQDNREEYRYMG